MNDKLNIKIPNVYLMAYYSAQPINKKFTHQAGYMKLDSNVHHNEQVIVARKIKNRDLQLASVILDVMNKKVVKCSKQPAADYDGLWTYYTTHYADYLKPLIELTEPIESSEFVNTEPNTAESSPITTAPSSTTISA